MPPLVLANLGYEKEELERCLHQPTAYQLPSYKVYSVYFVLGVADSPVSATRLGHP